MCAPLPFRHRTVTDPLNQPTLLSYNAAGDLSETEDPLGHLTRMHSDGAGRTTRTTTAKGYDWQQTYNGAYPLKPGTDDG